MAQAKKKTATKTAKKAPARAQARKQCATRTARRQEKGVKLHVYLITVMGMIAGLLLCANAAMLLV